MSENIPEAAAPAPAAPAPAQPKPRRRRKRLIAAAVVAVPVLLLLALIPGCPREFALPAQPEEWEIEAVHRFSARTGKIIVDQKGRLVSHAVIRFDETELNAILRTLLRAARLRRYPPTAAVWRQGGLDVEVSVPVRPVAINLSVRLIPEYRDGKFCCTAQNAWCGRLPLPGSAVASLINRFLAAEASRRKELAAAVAATERVSVNSEGGLEAAVQPKRAAAAMKMLMGM